MMMEIYPCDCHPIAPIAVLPTEDRRSNDVASVWQDDSSDYDLVSGIGSRDKGRRAKAFGRSTMVSGHGRLLP